MYHPKRALGSSAIILGTAFLVTACSGTGTGPEQTNTPPITTATITETPSATETGQEPTSSASATQTEPSTEMQTVSKHEVTLEIPATWTVEPEEECTAECNEYTQWNFKNQDGVTVLMLLPNTATSPDGDMNLYEREVLSSDSVPGLTFQPASVVAHHAVGTSQEDGEVTEFFSMAVVDDQVMADRGEEPDLDYFKTSEDAWPMLWVANDYFEAMGYREDGGMTREQAEEFLNSQDFTYLNSIMKTVRITE